MELNYPVIGYSEIDGKAKLNFRVDIDHLELMSREEWKKKAKRKVVKNYIDHFNRPPKNIAAALDWQLEQFRAQEVQSNESAQI